MVNVSKASIAVRSLDLLSTQSTREPEVVKGTCDKMVSGSIVKMQRRDKAMPVALRNVAGDRIVRDRADIF